MIYERKHRLDHTLYTGNVAVSYTACIHNRIPLFTDDDLVQECIRILIDESRKQHCEVLAYVFMPDHVHILLAGKDDSADTLRAMNMFKQRTGFWMYRHRCSGTWQKNYFDHIVRNAKNLRVQIRYILNNPVRKGLTKNWEDYRYIGSTMYPLRDWV